MSTAMSTATGLRRDGQLVGLEFPQGARTVLHVDSRDRDAARFPSASDFAVSLPETLKHVGAATLMAARVPAARVFTAARGTTSLKITLDGVTETVTIPDGDYDGIGQLLTTLSLACSQAFGSAFYEEWGDDRVRLDVSEPDNQVQQVRFLAWQGVPLSIDTSDPATLGLAVLLGFRAGVPAASPTGVVLAPFRWNMAPEPYVMLHIEELDTQVQCAMPSSRASGRRAFAKIPLEGNLNDDVSIRSLFYATNSGDTGSVAHPRPPIARLEKLRVSLRYHDGTLMDLGNREWSFTLVVERTLAG